MSDIFTTHHDFIKSYEIFRKKSENFSKNNELLREHLPQVIESILERKPRQTNFNILSVGSCTGKTDFEIIKIVKEELQKKPGHYSQAKIFNRAVEPNGYSLKVYQDNFDGIPSLSGDGKISLQLCETTFEDYTQAEKDEVKFDVIHFVHCLYYIDIESALSHCVEKELAEDGFILCIVGDKDFVKIGDHNINLSKEIQKVATKHGWKFEEVSQEYLIDITDIFKVESEEGNYLLDFLMQVKDFRVNKSEKEVMQALEAYKDAAMEDCGKLFFKRTNYQVIIRGK